MVKIHTKEKRKYGGGATLRKPRGPNRNRSTRPKSFKSEENAKKWAESQGIKSYDLKNLRPEYASDKKIIVIKKSSKQ